MELNLNNIPKIYKDYDERVINFLCNVFEDINEDNPKINKYFYNVFDLLANQLFIYYTALDAIKADTKVSSEDSYKRTAKNPAIAVMNHAHQEILNIMQKLSMSPFDKAKLKRVQSGEDIDSAEALLDSLVK